MRLFVARRHGPHAAFAVALLCVVVGLAVWDWIAVVLVAPWLGAVVWLVVRCGAETVIPTDGETFPSAAEAARRRLAVR